MYICMPYTLALNEPSLIFIPPPDEDDTEHGESPREPFVMQVTVKQAGKRHLEEFIVYFAVQREIVKAIENLVMRQAQGLYVPSVLEIEGQGLEGKARTKFILRGERKPWSLHDKVKLLWGDTPIRCCPDKWEFELELL